MCDWRDEPCNRTDNKARGLCAKHYSWATDHGRLGEYATYSTRSLVCCCDPPGPPDDECPRCHRPNLTPERIAYLRARTVTA
jgi:hypothetical protein